jgi:hypothetical protein
MISAPKMIAGESHYSSLFHVLRIDQLGDWARPGPGSTIVIAPDYPHHLSAPIHALFERNPGHTYL